MAPCSRPWEPLIVNNSNAGEFVSSSANFFDLASFFWSLQGILTNGLGKGGQ